MILKSACSYNASYIDRLISVFMRSLQKMVREHLSPQQANPGVTEASTGEGGAHLYTVCYTQTFSLLFSSVQKQISQVNEEMKSSCSHRTWPFFTYIFVFFNLPFAYLSLIAYYLL